MANSTKGLSVKFHSLTRTGGTHRSVYVGKGKKVPKALGKTITPLRSPKVLYRPYAIHARNLVQHAFVRPHVAGMVVHRKGLKGTRNPFPFNPLELRAVPKTQLRGTLPERIFYKACLDRRLVVGVDFSFQSSLDGGRMTFGGMVVDFIFPKKRLVVQIQGPTHALFYRIANDVQQAQRLAEMGYVVLDLWEETIFSLAALESFMQRYIDPGHLADISGTVTSLFIDPEQVNI